MSAVGTPFAFLAPGTLVRIGSGKTVWRVIGGGGSRWVYLASTTSSQAKTVARAHLSTV